MRPHDTKRVDFFVYPTGHRNLKMASKAKMKEAMGFDPAAPLQKRARTDKPARVLESDDDDGDVSDSS